MCEKTILKCCVSNGLFIYQAKKFCSEGRISAKLFKFVFHPVLVSWTYTKYESSQALSKQHMSSFGLACVIKKKFICPLLTTSLSVTDEKIIIKATYVLLWSSMCHQKKSSFVLYWRRPCPLLTVIFSDNEKSHSKLSKDSLGDELRNRLGWIYI